jgi:hypothetical protein
VFGLTTATRIFLAPHPIDMRKGIPFRQLFPDSPVREPLAKLEAPVENLLFY